MNRIHPPPAPGGAVIGPVAAALPVNEVERLAAVHRYAVLDTPAEQAYDDLTELASVICSAPISLFVLVDANRQWFKSRLGLDVQQTDRVQSFCSHAILRPDEVFEVPDATRDARFAGNPLVLGAPGIRFYAGAPLVTPEGHAVGTLCVIDRQPRHLEARERNALSTLARQVVAQLELRHAVAELEQQSMTDILTGAWNRRAFDRRLREEWAQHSRSGGPLGLLMIDVDNFKGYNDAFGHLAGDEVLKQVVMSARTPLRVSDTLSRYGGEEFTVLLPQVGLTDAMLIAERVRLQLMRVGWPLRPVTVSIGVAVMTPVPGADRHALVARADRALYRAKALGRDRCEPFVDW